MDGLTSPVAGLAGPDGWPGRREAIRAAWRRLAGTVPAPGAWPLTPVLRAGERRFPGGAERRLAVGSPPLRLRLLVPDAPGPHPVLLVPESHLPWAAAAVRRGWAACLVSACDAGDDTQTIAAATPGCDGGRIAWRAWAFSRALDVLVGERGIDAGRVVVAGHSRNGKAALLAAGFDERFAGVASSSSGVLGAVPARLCCDRHFGEGVELLTRHYPGWYHPRLREWAGREEELPTDAHELLALAAPRPVLVSVAVNDPVESTWAAEAAVDCAREAYALLGVPDALELRWRAGGHELSPEGVEALVDWAAGGGAAAPPERLHPAGFAPWRATAPAARPLLRGPELRAAVEAALGAAPPRAAAGAAPHVRGERDHAAWLLGRGDAGGRRLVTADGVDVTVLGPPDGLPALWLGPPCRATGWHAGYEDGPGMARVLAAAGWAVACHDPIGSGARIAEGAAFARRHPGWTLLGRMVLDAAAAAEAAGAPAWVAAYGTGAIVAAHLAVLRPELVAGAVLVAPTSGDPLVRGSAGYTLADLLGAVRAPVIVFDPARDPEAPEGAVAAACAAAGVERRPLEDWHRLAGGTRAAVAAWLAAAAPVQA